MHITLDAIEKRLRAIYEQISILKLALTFQNFRWIISADCCNSEQNNRKNIETEFMNATFINDFRSSFHVHINYAKYARTLN